MIYSITLQIFFHSFFSCWPPDCLFHSFPLAPKNLSSLIHFIAFSSLSGCLLVMNSLFLLSVPLHCPVPSLSLVGRSVAGTRLSLSVRWGSTATRPLRPHGRPRTASPRPQPPSGSVKSHCCRPGGWSARLPPRHLCPAPPSVSPYQATFPVPHPLHCWWAKTWGEQGQGATVLQPHHPGSRACGRRVKLEWVGAHAHRA